MKTYFVVTNRRENKLSILSDLSECVALVRTDETDIICLVAHRVETAISVHTLKRTLLVPTLCSCNTVSGSCHFEPCQVNRQGLDVEHENRDCGVSGVFLKFNAKDKILRIKCMDILLVD